MGSYGVVVFIEVCRQKMLILSISIQELEMLSRIGKDQKETGPKRNRSHPNGKERNKW